MRGWSQEPEHPMTHPTPAEKEEKCNGRQQLHCASTWRVIPECVSPIVQPIQVLGHNFDTGMHIKLISKSAHLHKIYLITNASIASQMC